MEALDSTPFAELFLQLEARLVHELRRSGASISDTPIVPMHAHSSRSSGAGLANLYRFAADVLNEKVARENGHPPMTKHEVDLMCRCMATRKTLGEAITIAREFCAMLHPRAATLELRLESGAATFLMHPVRRKTSSAACLLDVTGLLCFIHFFGWLLGRPVSPVVVYLAHPEREDVAAFLGVLGAPVVVGADSSGFKFDAALLKSKIIRQPVELDDCLERLPFDFVASPASTVSAAQRVRSLLDAAMAVDRPLLRVAEIANALNLTSITLRRRLASDGTSYNELREQSLKNAAQHYLANTTWSIDKIASRLGFSSAAAFRRAFVNWCGLSPSRYRRAMWPNVRPDES
ncbi:AraC-type transcriptional regulator [Paraburkholderia sp. BL18I3N2]|uniref:AraC family transcriptional regulator n=1 Tax=Paraburkholderia sp. BL18I3N2 TaxID=1938799 RepID=UPI000D06B03F|nr:AraC family transcriptional regulator [Paraburkholderia sp. BL18I3N2]PRX27376.1 AraC-type transcriptional regulator [Paraburkholderia sp. BL18I3N2]